MTDTKKTRSRGRPRCFDRATAVKTALTLFRQKGYDGVGVAELSQALGIKPPSLYAAFGNKHGLFEEAVQSYAAEEGRFIVDVINRANSPEELVNNILVEAAEAFCRKQDQAGCLILDGTRNCTDSHARATTAAMRQQTKKHLEKAFSSYHMENGAVLAEYVLIAMTGLSGAARQGVSRNLLVQVARRFASAVAAETDG